MPDEIWNEFDTLIDRAPWLVRGAVVVVALLGSLVPLLMAYHASVG